MDDKIPCCQLDAARRVRQIEIEGVSVGIAQLDDIFDQISQKTFETEAQLKNELLAQVKIYNYIPSSAEQLYQDAIYKEYRIYQKNKEVR